MEMVSMAHPEQFLNKLIIIVALLMLSCNSSKQIKPGDVPNVYVNAGDASLHQHEGVLYSNQQPYSGYTFETFKNGDTAKVTPYLNGKEEGWRKGYYPNKQLAEERFYKQGKKEGAHKAWWPNGSLKFEYHFINDEHDGELKEWFSNGKLSRLFHYVKGHEDGSQKMWWENGDIRANYVIKEGKRFGLIGQKLCRNVLKDSLQ
jgi:antitoxin component YwqK of YwqJK toxin-antitoxin module